MISNATYEHITCDSHIVLIVSAAAKIAIDLKLQKKAVPAWISEIRSLQ